MSVAVRNSTAGLDHQKSENAKQRWKILREVLSGQRSSQTCQNAASVRRFSSYNLLKTSRMTISDTSDEVVWYKYTSSAIPDFSMAIRHLSGKVKPEQLFGFNNTGNVCVWPSEEILAHYCLTHLDLFRDKSICELGGGMTCLAGIATAINSEAKYVEVTDGNEDSVDNLTKIINSNENKLAFGQTAVSTRVLRWGCGKLDNDLQGRFDIVLCADCLFFDQGRNDLIKLVMDLLKPGGLSLMFAPRRGTTFDEFVKLASKTIDIEVQEQYDDEVWDLHCKMKAKGIEHYNEDIHYPLYLSWKKEDCIR